MFKAECQISPANGRKLAGVVPEQYGMSFRLESKLSRSAESANVLVERLKYGMGQISSGYLGAL